MSHREKPSSSLTYLSTDAGDMTVDLSVQEEGVGDEVRRTLGALMPWGVSILAHVVLIVFAFFLVWQTIVPKEDQRPVVPAIIATPNMPDPVSFEIPTQDKASASSAAVLQPMITPPSPVDPSLVGNDRPMPKSDYNPIPGSGIMGQAIPHGKGIKGGGIGLYEMGGDYDRVVFLIDASGSMVDVLPFVINELDRSINESDPDVRATVIFFSGSGVFEVPGAGRKSGLRPLTPGFKAELRQWVKLENHRYDVGGRGSRFVQDAIARGLGYKPQAVFLLSDNLTGGGQGATRHELMQKDLLELVAAKNSSTPPARINTIQFLYEDPLVRFGLPGTLEQIAKHSGGQFTFKSATDLKLK